MKMTILYDRLARVLNLNMYICLASKFDMHENKENI